MSYMGRKANFITKNFTHKINNNNTYNGTNIN